jgi:hypothetical protein
MTEPQTPTGKRLHTEAWDWDTSRYTVDGHSSDPNDCPACAIIVKVEDEAIAIEATEHKASFDLRWKADMRAIEMWQKAHPGNDLVWPDHADLVVWLLERLGQKDPADA